MGGDADRRRRRALAGTTTDAYYGEYTLRPFASLDMTDPDVDGDTVLDGADDQDNDDWTNASEMYHPRSVNTSAGPRRSNAFNPCAPERSRTCPRYEPVATDRGTGAGRAPGGNRPPVGLFVPCPSASPQQASRTVPA